MDEFIRISLSSLREGVKIRVHVSCWCWPGHSTRYHTVWGVKYHGVAQEGVGHAVVDDVEEPTVLARVRDVREHLCRIPREVDGGHPEVCRHLWDMTERIMGRSQHVRQFVALGGEGAIYRCARFREDGNAAGPPPPSTSAARSRGDEVTLPAAGCGGDVIFLFES